MSWFEANILIINLCLLLLCCLGWTRCSRAQQPTLSVSQLQPPVCAHLQDPQAEGQEVDGRDGTHVSLFEQATCSHVLRWRRLALGDDAHPRAGHQLEAQRGDQLAAHGAHERDVDATVEPWTTTSTQYNGLDEQPRHRRQDASRSWWWC